MDVSELLGTAATIVAVASLAGVGLIRGTVTNLRENLKDMRDENADLRRRLSERESDLLTAKGDLAAVERIKTGKFELDEINTKLDEHHDITIAMITQITKSIEKALSILDRVSSELSTMVDKIVSALKRSDER